MMNVCRPKRMRKGGSTGKDPYRKQFGGNDHRETLRQSGRAQRLFSTMKRITGSIRETMLALAKHEQKKQQEGIKVS